MIYWILGFVVAVILILFMPLPDESTANIKIGYHYGWVLKSREIEDIVKQYRKSYWYWLLIAVLPASRCFSFIVCFYSNSVYVHMDRVCFLCCQPRFYQISPEITGIETE
jgi:hypothetical protein